MSGPDDRAPAGADPLSGRPRFAPLRFVVLHRSRSDQLQVGSTAATIEEAREIATSRTRADGKTRLVAQVVGLVSVAATWEDAT